MLKSVCPPWFSSTLLANSNCRCCSYYSWTCNSKVWAFRWAFMEWCKNSAISGLSLWRWTCTFWSLKITIWPVRIRSLWTAGWRAVLKKLIIVGEMGRVSGWCLWGCNCNCNCLERLGCSDWKSKAVILVFHFLGRSLSSDSIKAYYMCLAARKRSVWAFLRIKISPSWHLSLDNWLPPHFFVHYY